MTERSPGLVVRFATSASLLLGGLLGAPGCSSHEDQGPELRVFAAASLAESFAALATAFQADYAKQAAHAGLVDSAQLRVSLHTAGTPQLLLQLREGARADVFASANEATMSSLLQDLTASEEAADTQSPGIPQIFAHNALALLVARGNPLGITQLADLSRADLRFAIAGPHVPAGDYARAALALAGVDARSRSDETSVRGVVQKVLLGELDAGIVYASELHGRDFPLEFVSIPAAYQPTIRYPIVALPQAEQPQLAAAFVNFVLSETGQSILRTHGFSAAR